jgi:hypothetical protein
VTEYHGGPKCLTRIALSTRMVGTTILVNFVILSYLMYQFLTAASGTPWYLASYGALLTLFFILAYRLKRRVAELVEAAAQRIGLKRVKD